MSETDTHRRSSLAPGGPGGLMRGSRSVLVAVLVVTIASACGGLTESDEEGSNNLITIASSESLPSLDAHVLSSSPVMAVFDNIYEQLYEFEPDGTLYPELAAELPKQVADDRWRVSLRKNVEFSNGEAFNADSAIQNIERMTDPKTASAFYDQVASITGAEKVDDYTIEVLTEGFDVVLPQSLTYIRMMSPSSIEGNAYDTEDTFGTGPYQVDSWDKASSITLARNDSYWGDQAKIAKAKFVFLEEPGTRIAALKSGEVDVMMALSPDDRSQVPEWANASDEAVVLAQPNSSPDRVTGDVRVRRALMYAMDRESIAKNLYEGNAKVLHGAPLAENWFGFDPDAPFYEYDPDKAAALISEAGAKGETLTVVYDAGRWPRIAEITQVLQEAWTKAGLKVELQNKPGEAWVDSLNGVTERGDLIMVQTTNEFQDASLTADKYLNPDSMRATHKDAKLEGLINAAVQTSDEDKRLDLYSQIIEINHQQMYSMPIVSEPSGEVAMATNVNWTPGNEARPLVANMSFN